MCNTCQSAVPVCKCQIKPAVDWAKPVMFENDPDTPLRVICTDRAGGWPVLLLRTYGGSEVIIYCKSDGKPIGSYTRIVNRPEYRYKNVYEAAGHLAHSHSTMEEAIAVARKAICVVQYTPGDNSSAKIVHTY